MQVNVGDTVILRKQHPCGSKTFTVTRVGMDFKFKCHGCGHELMLPRTKAERAIKSVQPKTDTGENDV